MNRLFVLSILALTALLLAGCAGSGEKISVTIQDKNITTQADVAPGMTVSQLLQEVEIPVGEQDQVEPSPDAKVTDNDTQIVVSRYAKVTILDEDNTTEVELLGGCAEDALKEAKITLGPDDSLDCRENAFLENGMTINVTRVRTISLKVNGKKKKVKTSARTVEELFEEQNLTVGKKDRLNVKLTDKLQDGDKIVLDYVAVKKETVEETIPYGTQTQYSDSMNKGTSKVSRAGVNGKKELTYKVTYVNGKEESRELTKEEVIQEPVNQIVVYGTKVVPTGPTVVSRQNVYDCDGSGHGYTIVTYSDGTVKYVDF